MKLKFFSATIVFLTLLLPPAFAQQLLTEESHVRAPRRYSRVERPLKLSNLKRTKADAVPTIHALVVLAAYDDVDFTYTKERFDSLLNVPGYDTDGATGSVKDYFRSQFSDQVNFDFVVSDIVKVSKSRSHYGVNDSATKFDMRACSFIAEACSLLDDSLDFSIFDNDNDGYMDNVFVIFAGEDEAQQEEGKNSDYMWSHSYALSGTQSDYRSKAPLVLDGIKIDRYACSSELYRRYSTDVRYEVHMTGIGTFCHEFSHILGLVDFYDTDYEKSGGTAAGHWRYTSLMDAGNYNNFCNTPPNYNAIDLSLLDLQKPQELEPGEYTLYPAGSPQAQTYCISNPADSTEAYIFECRTQNGWDSFIKGKGMLVYHVDMSNTRKTDSDDYNSITSYDRWFRYNQVNCRPDHQCADLIEADGRTDKNPTVIAYSNIEGIFFPQSGSSSIGSAYTVKLPFWDGTASPYDIIDIKFDGQKVTLNVQKAGEVDPTIPTAPPTDEDPLYIVSYYGLDSLSKTIPAGTEISFRVSNDISSKEVRWFFDKERIDPTKFVATKSGRIRAEIEWEDGSTDYLFKTLTVVK